MSFEIVNFWRIEKLKIKIQNLPAKYFIFQSVSLLNVKVWMLPDSIAPIDITNHRKSFRSLSLFYPKIFAFFFPPFHSLPLPEDFLKTHFKSLNFKHFSLFLYSKQRAFLSKRYEVRMFTYTYMHYSFIYVFNLYTENIVCWNSSNFFTGRLFELRFKQFSLPVFVFV